MSRVVVICGSMRFRGEMDWHERNLITNGLIPIAPTACVSEGMLTTRVKADLDELHLMKVAMADRILVVNPGGYIGESTRREIAVAQSLGKPVDYVEPCNSLEVTPSA